MRKFVHISFAFAILIFGAGCTENPLAPEEESSISVDIKINDSDGPVIITTGEPWSITWTSFGAEACQLTYPSGESGLALQGSSGPLYEDHPWYPTASRPTTLTLKCWGKINRTGAVAIDSVTVRV